MNDRPPAPSTDAAERMKYVFVITPTCPACGSSCYRTNRTDRDTDGTRTQGAVCRECAAKFKIVWEAPQDLGITETEPLT